MVRIFVFGTVKRDFLCTTLGCAARHIAAPIAPPCLIHLIAGPWFAPTMFNETGVGRRVTGELYAADEILLANLDAIESVGKPGNVPISIAIDGLHGIRPCAAFVYVKARKLATPVHSGYLSSYQDRRFIPPGQREDRSPETRKAQ